MLNLKTAFFSLFAGFICLACQRDPDFPNEPIISIESLTRGYDGFSSDTIVLRLRFQDGNGDLGISNSERLISRPINRNNANKPFHPYFYTFSTSGQVLDSTANKFSNNLFVTTYRRNALGVFELVQFPSADLTFTGTFPILYEGNRQTPMEGVIRYKMSPTPPLFKKNDLLRFDIQIADRSKTLSNMVSDTIRLKME